MLGEEGIISLAARVSHAVNKAYSEFLGDNSQVDWHLAPIWQRKSAVMGVKIIQEKPNITPAQQHSCWMAHKFREGWVWGEEKSEINKTHPCLLPYDQLPEDQKLKDFLFGASVRSVLNALKVDDSTNEKV